MSMDKTAIEKIQEAPSIATANEKAITQLEASINTRQGCEPFVILPDGNGGLKPHSLEKHLQHRYRFRGQMHTSVMRDFAEFVKDNVATSGSACFIDPDTMKATVIFNLGDQETPGHADFTGALKLKATSEFTALLDADQTSKPQKAMAEWLEDWEPNLTFLDEDGNPVASAKAISAVRRMKIEARRNEDHAAENFRNSRSTFESIEAKSEHGLPHAIEFTCTPYEGLNERTFQARLSVLKGGETPAFGFKIKHLEVQREHMSEEFMGTLKEHLPTDQLKIYRGDFSK